MIHRVGPSAFSDSVWGCWGRSNGFAQDSCLPCGGSYHCCFSVDSMQRKVKNANLPYQVLTPLRKNCIFLATGPKLCT